jgi:hypothetical protein
MAEVLRSKAIVAGCAAIIASCAIAICGVLFGGLRFDANRGAPLSVAAKDIAVARSLREPIVITLRSAQGVAAEQEKWRPAHIIVQGHINALIRHARGRLVMAPNSAAAVNGPIEIHLTNAVDQSAVVALREPADANGFAVALSQAIQSLEDDTPAPLSTTETAKKDQGLAPPAAVVRPASLGLAVLAAIAFCYAVFLVWRRRGDGAR